MKQDDTFQKAFPDVVEVSKELVVMVEGQLI
jgi:hypothetical protein